MENITLFEIISGIISFIALIVFFVMASNVSKINKNNAHILSIFYKYAKRDKLITYIKCSYCKNKYPDDLDKCPYCGNKNDD